jgi:hypothetical protein
VAAANGASNAVATSGRQRAAIAPRPMTTAAPVSARSVADTPRMLPKSSESRLTAGRAWDA